MLMVFLLQLIIPLLMLLSLALARPSNKAGLMLKMFAIGAWLLAIDLTGLWTALPWWTPRVLLIAAAVTATWRYGRSRCLPAMPDRPMAWLGASVWLAVFVAAMLQSVSALQGRLPHAAPIAHIASPFDTGLYLVVNGGLTTSVNAHLRTLSDDPRFRPWRGQSYGVDLIRISASGLRARGLRPAEPDAYLGFGTRVVAPCAGSIVQAVDGQPDNIVPQTDRHNMAGNHVIVRCGEFDIVLAHLRRGSVKVTTGDQVKAGEPIGELGNSGNSDEPHLHVHAQRHAPVDAPFSAEPVPIRIDGGLPVRNQRMRGRRP